MNRKERRAARKQAPGSARAPAQAGLPAAAALFEQAIRHHQAGQWPESEALCRAIVAREPKHVGSLHLLGVIAQQRGQFEDAAGFFRKVIAIRPDVAVAHLGLGAALAAGGQPGDAVKAFERALAQKRPGPEDARTLLDLGNLYSRLDRVEEAARSYRRLLELQPDHAEAHNGLGAMLLAQGQRQEAAGEFARALTLAPELFEAFSQVSATLRQVDPALDEAARCAAAVPPRPPSPDALAAMAGDPMLLCALESSTLRDLELEKLFTAIRALLLDRAAASADAAVLLPLSCALARQCFINEYVFAETASEREQADALTARLVAALKDGGEVPVSWIAAVASYTPLGTLPNPQSLLDRNWPLPIEALLTQQVREMLAERQLRASMPRLTAIEEGDSALVRQQYEENPYPRWVLPPSRRPPVGVDEFLRTQMPWAAFAPLGERANVDILIAGCGTGEHPIGMARRYRGARVLAIDLSLSSLGYAARKTRELGLQNIEYAQADILKLASVGRSFDLIDASGVLHHLADPAAGWRELLALLRPRGLMRVGLYSELARADIVATRGFIAERGFAPTAPDIRRCRQALLDTPLRTVSRYRDFYGTSECRDLLFHVQEQRLTLPAIKEFLAAQRLQFIGFEIDAATVAAYRARHPEDPAMTDLDRWHAFETERPATFAAMYQFWVQKG